MRLIATLVSVAFGIVVGGFIAYLIYTRLYPLYASHHPLDPGMECSRGNAIAYLSILIGALLVGTLLAVKVWRHY